MRLFMRVAPIVAWLDVIIGVVGVYPLDWIVPKELLGGFNDVV